jgi:hypothetical protein
MISALRAFFLSRALREKLLLVAFVGIGLSWWGSAFSKRLGRFWVEQRTTTARLSEQAEWIKNKASIEKTAAQTAQRLDPSRTLNGNQLATTIATLANDAGLKNATTAGNSQTARSGQFALHSVSYTIRNADWAALSTFYKAVQQRTPYIAVEQFILSAPANNEAQLVLGLKVASVEIVR